jgi:hypothetical protein
MLQLKSYHARRSVYSVENPSLANFKANHPPKKPRSRVSLGGIGLTGIQSPYCFLACCCSPYYLDTPYPQA